MKNLWKKWIFIKPDTNPACTCLQRINSSMHPHLFHIDQISSDILMLIFFLPEKIKNLPENLKKSKLVLVTLSSNGLPLHFT